MTEIKLFWEGLWDISEEGAPLNIPETGGILMLIDARYTPNKIGFDTGTYSLVELCDSDNMYNTLRNPLKFQGWKKLTQNRLLVKIAKLENQGQRREIVDLLSGSPFAPSNLIVLNSGYKLPLKSYYAALNESAA